MQYDGTNVSWVCPAPYEEVIKHVQFNTIYVTAQESGKLKEHKANGSAIGCVRDLTWANGGKIQEKCIMQ